MTAKLELRDHFGLNAKWVDRLTNHEAEGVLTEVRNRGAIHDASFGEGAFEKDTNLCKQATFETAMKKLFHRGIPAEKQ